MIDRPATPAKSRQRHEAAVRSVSRREHPAHRAQLHPGSRQIGFKPCTGKDLEFSQTRFDQQISVTRSETGMTHQQVAVAGTAQPASEQLAKAAAPPLKVVHPQQVSVLRITESVRGRGQPTRAQRLDHQWLEAPRRACGVSAPRARCEGRPDPGRSVIPAGLQFRQEFAAHHRQLMHMLVPIDVCRGVAHELLECVELRPNFSPDVLPIEQPQVTRHDQFAQRAV